LRSLDYSTKPSCAEINPIDQYFGEPKQIPISLSAHEVSL